MDALEAIKLNEVQVDDKGFVPAEVRNKFFQKLRMKNENRICFECDSRNPQWISITYGVFLCLDCSGQHRRKGTHISFVRGAELDQFTPEQIVQMAVGGNGRAWNYFKGTGMGKTSESRRAIEYTSSGAKRYKNMIIADTAAACKKIGLTGPAGQEAATDAVDAAADSANAAQPPADAETPEAAAAPESQPVVPFTVELDFMDALEAAQLDRVPINDKCFVPEDVRNAFFRKMRMKNENRTCFECSVRGPDWVSITYGIFLCLDCSGQHRKKGVHLSFVRGAELDQFTPEQIVQMGVGGNRKAWAYFKQHGMGKTSEIGKAIDYSSRIAQKYKQQMIDETAATCKQLRVSTQPPAAAVPAAAGAAPAGAAKAAPAPAPAPAAPAANGSGITAPQKPAEGPKSVIIRKAAANTIRKPEPAAGYTGSAAPTASSAVQQDDFAGFANAAKAAAPVAVAQAPQLPKAPVAQAPERPKAKAMDIDFDFDELDT